MKRSAFAAGLWLSTLLTVLPFSAPGAPQSRCDSLLVEKNQVQVATEEFRDVQAVVDQILIEFPPAQYVFLGLGRSPTPIMALLQARGHDVINLPLTGMRARLGDKSDVETRALNRADTAKLMQHFDNFLHPEAIKGRKILVIDFALSGASLLSARDYLGLYSQSHSKMLFEYLALVGFQYDGNRVANLAQMHQLSISKQSLLITRLEGQYYDDFAQFGAFHLGRDPLGLSGYNDLYDDLVEEYRLLDK